MRFLLAFLSLASMAWGQDVPSQPPFVVRVTTFGNGMSPVSPRTNNAERIIYSENLYSQQPGGRQLRSGIARFGDTITSVDSAVRSLEWFVPKHDSGALILTSGGKWFGNSAGKRVTSVSPSFDWKAYLSAARQIRPYPGGDSVRYGGDTLRGYNSRFTRDLQPGDTVTVDGLVRRVKHIRSDEHLTVASSWGAADTARVYTASRSYPVPNFKPFLFQSGDRMYSGTAGSSPQVIYVKDDTLRIRHLGIVDSFYIDTVYSKYPRTIAAWDSLDYRRRSWDTIPLADSARFIKEIQLVSRRKAGEWSPDKWLQTFGGGPEAYYVRVGYRGQTQFYQIAGNTDTSIFLAALYVDTTKVDGGAAVKLSDSSWVDSIFLDKVPILPDTLDAVDVEGKWGYIYCAVGFSDVVVPDNETGSVALRGRGALFYTIDAGFPIDTAEMYKAMHYIHLTGSDIGFSAYSNSMSRTLREYYRRSITPLTFVSPDTVLVEFPTWYCGCDLGRNWEDDYETALEECRSCLSPGLIQGYGYKVATRKTNRTTIDAQVLANAYFPILSMSKSGDTMFFVTPTSYALVDPQIVSTSQWEIIRIDMPNWSGMEEWGTPPQSVAWGDTAAPSLLSFAAPLNPWDWSVSRDVLVGNDPSDPVVSVITYDDQLVVGKTSSMQAYNGSQFVELSQSDGFIAPDAVVGLTKEMFFLDVDGLKWMSRRDFSGYSITSISTDMDPTFNAWSAIQFGASVVPVVLSPKYRKNAVLVYNQRDHHLYLFATFGLDTTIRTNNGCLTYDTRQRIWDGYFTIAATDAVWATIRDTSRIIIGSKDSATVFALDYAYNDLGSNINSRLVGGEFWGTDNNGRQMFTQLSRVVVNTRSTSGGLDSAMVLFAGESGTDTMRLTGYPAGSVGVVEQVFRPDKGTLSVYWGWEMKTWGSAAASVFQPVDMTIWLEPVGRKE
jgi:hypothetical protein